MEDSAEPVQSVHDAPKFTAISKRSGNPAALSRRSRIGCLSDAKYRGLNPPRRIPTGGTGPAVRMRPNALRETPKARAILGLLERHGWLVRLDAGAVVRGSARTEAWRIVRGDGGVV